ncbi:MAG TPA: hypothetical protein VD903_02275, partial [Pseudonocardia sp.]|nr:hypothetical protein [Pseudonocardia sp.]
MARRSRGRKPATRNRGPARHDPREGEPGEPDLLADITGALEAEHPVAFLGLASALLAALAPASPTPFAPEPDPETPSREEIVEGLFAVDALETSALLTAVAAFSGDELLRRRVHREVARRAHALPRWLAGLERAEPSGRTVEVVHVLRDGDNVLLGARLPGGADLTAVVYIDHNMGTVVKDAYVVPLGVDDLVEQMLAVADDPDTQARDLDPADARIRISEAIEHGAMTYPPLESEDWPACRPLVEWLTAMLPPGGRGEQRPDWDEAAVAALADRFFASSFGAAFDDEDGRHLLDSLLWFRTDYGFG